MSPHFICGFDLIDCDVKNSVIKNCDIYSTEIKNSEVLDSQIFGGNNIQSSKIERTSVAYGTKLTNCFINSPGKSLDCEIDGGVIRAGNTAKNAEISKSTELVKGWSEERNSRFVTDTRLKNLNKEYRDIIFKNKN